MWESVVPLCLQLGNTHWCLCRCWGRTRPAQPRCSTAGRWAVSAGGSARHCSLLLSRILGSDPGGSVSWAPSSGISSCLPLQGFLEVSTLPGGLEGKQKAACCQLWTKMGNRWNHRYLCGQHPGSERASSFPPPPALSFNSPSPGVTCALRPPPDRGPCCLRCPRSLGMLSPPTLWKPPSWSGGQRPDQGGPL